LRERKDRANDCIATVAFGRQLCQLLPMHLLHDPAAPAAPSIGFDQFLAVDIRIGEIRSASPLEGARKPAYVLEIDFGPVIGVKKSSAQITENYRAEDLPGRQIAAVVNFPPRQIGKMMSEVLTLGFADAAGTVILFAPDKRVPNGSRLF
jgi:tRNA-binding protein